MPGVRSTFGTSTELLNVLRLMSSRLGSHLCPNGHRLAPTIEVAQDKDLVCPECAAVFYPPGAEVLAFNSEGACPACSGTGVAREIDEASLVPDHDKSIDAGAVAPWSMFGLTVMPRVVADFGVRTDIPYRDLTEDERRIVMHGPAEQRRISVPSKNGKLFELNFTYRNARQAVQEALDNATTEKGLNRVERFITAATCASCHGTRLSEKARGSKVMDLNLAEVTAMTLEEVIAWASIVPDSLPEAMRQMARNLVATLQNMAVRLIDLGLGYLSLDRASLTLSTGERQRVQLARAVRNETTGVLYVLDEPSIRLHPANVEGLTGVIRDLLRDGNSVVLVDHDVQVLREADYVIEIGPGSGPQGGTVLAAGTVDDIGTNPASLLGGFLTGHEPVIVRERASPATVFNRGTLHLETTPLHTVQALSADIPLGQLTAVTGMSGSGKTTLILESLVPALQAGKDTVAPAHVKSVDAAGIEHVHVVDATPIGVNVRSTIATYSGIMDDLRREFAALDAVKERALTAADFSYNTGSLRCLLCEGTSQIVLDVQFLLDVDIDCPECNGTRYSPGAGDIRRPSPQKPEGAGVSLPELLGMSLTEAVTHLRDIRKVRTRLQALI